MAIAGGIAVFLTLVLTGLLSIAVTPTLWKAIQVRPLPMVGLALSSFGIVVLGFLDDRFTIRGRQKLAGQILACFVLVCFGYQIQGVQLFGWTFELSWLAYPISIGWLLFTINALNLIDGADGLCSTIGWVASAGIAAMAMYTGHYIESFVAASLAGALLGFLVFNFPPAKIFLGDTGSMLIGLLLGALSVRSSLKEATATSMLVPITILAISVV